jgi:hypothetical protein
LAKVREAKKGLNREGAQSKTKNDFCARDAQRSADQGARSFASNRACPVRALIAGTDAFLSESTLPETVSDIKLVSEQNAMTLPSRALARLRGWCSFKPIRNTPVKP